MEFCTKVESPSRSRLAMDLVMGPPCGFVSTQPEPHIITSILPPTIPTAGQTEEIPREEGIVTGYSEGHAEEEDQGRETEGGEGVESEGDEGSGDEDTRDGSIEGCGNEGDMDDECEKANAEGDGTVEGDEVENEGNGSEKADEQRDVTVEGEEIVDEDDVENAETERAVDREVDEAETTEELKEIVVLDDEPEAEEMSADERTSRRNTRRSKNLEDMMAAKKARKLQFGTSDGKGETREDAPRVAGVSRRDRGSPP